MSKLKTRTKVKLQENDYKEAYQHPPNFSIHQERVTKYSLLNHYVHVSSAARDTSLYPLHYDYKITFQTPYRSIKKIKMLYATMPEITIATEPVIAFSIDELNYIPFVTKNGYRRVFSSFPTSQAYKTGHSFLTLKEESQELEFKTPLANLSSLTIKLYNIDYEPITFSAPSGSIDKLYQHSFVLQITTQESSMETIEYRKVLQD